MQSGPIRILLTPWHFLNRIYPFAGLAHELKKRGHEVAFYTGEAARPIVEGEGFPCFPFQQVNEAEVDYVVENLIAESAGRRRSKELRHWWHEYLLKTVPGQLGDLEKIIRDWRPDVLVCDVAMWGPILVMYEKTGIPVALFPHLAYCLLPGPDGGFPGIRLPRSRFWPIRLYTRLATKVIGKFVGAVPQEANKLRASHGLPPLRASVNEYCGELPLFLIPGAAEFDYSRHDLPPSVHYIGSALWDKNANQAPPAWLPEIPRDKPVVVVTEEAVFPKEPLMLKMAAAGLANLPLTVILIAGPGRDPSKLGIGPVAPNMRLVAQTPLSDLLPITDLVVTNGNSPTVMATLHAGIPLVVVPSIFDQSDVAWRVADNQVGIRIAASKCTPEQVRGAVETVLAKPAFKERAQRFSQYVKQAGGATKGAELVEELAARTATLRSQAANR